MIDYQAVCDQQKKNYDVIVAGGGTAGWTAALAAARNGKRVLVVERKGYLGGALSSGLLVLGFHDSDSNQIVKGYAQEFLDRVQQYNGCEGHHLSDMWHNSMSPLNSPVVKQVIIEMLVEAGVEILMYAQITDVIMDGNVIKGLKVQKKSESQLYFAKTVIDATGDGIVSYFAGARILNTLENLQPPTLLFRMENVDMGKMREFIVANPDSFVNWRMKPGKEKTEEFLRTTQLFFLMPELIEQFPFVGEYAPIIDRIMLLAVPHANAIVVNMLRSKHVDCTSSESMTAATIHQYQNMIALFEFLRKHVPGCEKAYLADSEPEIQIRESRRIEGEYILSEQDIYAGRRFEDSIAVGGYMIDVHTNDSHCACEYTGQSYGIPYKTMIPKGIENLLVAGRCISGTKAASGSYRVMATCMAVGQAAGTACALACEKEVPPRVIDVKELRAMLVRENAVID